MEYVIAIDLGATQISVGIVGEDLSIVKVNRENVAKGEKDALTKQIYRMIETLPYEKYSVKNVGVAACGIIEDGIMKFGANIGINNYDIKSLIEMKYPTLTVKVINDAHASALVESVSGAAKDVDSSLLMTISSGIGGALVLHNQVVDMPCEIGHTYVKYRRGLEQVERLCSGEGIIRLCKDNYLPIEHTVELFEKVDKHDPIAEKILDEWSEIVGCLFANLQMEFNVDTFILTGGVMKSAHKHIDRIVDFANDYIKETLLPLKPIKVVTAIYRQDSGLFGAATLAFSNK